MGRYKKHRKKIEKIIGRKLGPDEVVHHKDRNPENNDPANLMVLTKKEHYILHFKGIDAFYRYKRGKIAS